MKKFISSLFILFVISCAFAQNVVIDECKVTKDYGFQQYTFSVYGDVYVETDPKEPVELEVKIASRHSGADFTIYRTTDTPKQCGEWRFVNNKSKADFSIRFVNEWEDCTIIFTSNRDDAGWNIVLRR